MSYSSCVAGLVMFRIATRCDKGGMQVCASVTYEPMHDHGLLPNLAEVGKHLVLGAILGPIAAKLIPGLKIGGITAGRNSAGAIAKAIKTKIEHGTVSSMSAKTAANAAAADATENAARSVGSDEAEGKASNEPQNQLVNYCHGSDCNNAQ